MTDIMIDGVSVFDLTSFCDKFNLKKNSFRATHRYKYPEKIKVLSCKKYYPIEMTPDDWYEFKAKYVQIQKQQIYRVFEFSNDDYELAEEFYNAILEENKKNNIVARIRISTARGDVDPKFPPYLVIVDFDADVYAKEVSAFIRRLRNHFPDLYSSRWAVTMINVVTKKHILEPVSIVNGKLFYRGEDK